MINPKNLSLDVQRICPVCSSNVYGRSDKIYCTPKCKDSHYAKKRKELAIFHKVTLRQLARNHFVLDLFSGDAEKFTVNLSALKDLGFDPNFITGMEQNKYGHKYRIFNYCWYPANTQNIVIYRDKVENPLCDFTYKRWLQKHHHQAIDYLNGLPIDQQDKAP